MFCLIVPFLHDNVMMFLTFCGNCWSSTDRRIRGTLSVSYSVCRCLSRQCLEVNVFLYENWIIYKSLHGCCVKLLHWPVYHHHACWLYCWNVMKRENQYFFCTFQLKDNAFTSGSRSHETFFFKEIWWLNLITNELMSSYN